MLQAKCILKFRDKNGKIIGYKLQDPTGYIKDVLPEQLKKAINAKKIHITNLTLTSDYRLVDNGDIECKDTRSESDKTADFITKSRLFGYEIEELIITNNNKVYIVKTGEQDYLIYIPDEVKALGLKFSQHIRRKFWRARERVKVVGGSGLISGEDLFFNCRFNTLDLSNLDTSNMVTMENMFAALYCNELILTNFNTRKVKNMSKMFYQCKVCEKPIDISSFDTSNTLYMLSMFEQASLYTDFSNIKTTNAKNLTAMFKRYRCKELNLNHFDLNYCISVSETFKDCVIEDLYINEWKLPDKCYTVEAFKNFRGVIHMTDEKLKKQRVYDKYDR